MKQTQSKLYWEEGHYVENNINGCDLVKELGRGSFGIVYLGINKKTKQKFAVKIIEVTKI